MKIPNIFPKKNLHETDLKVISDDFKNRSDFLATTLVDTNRKLDTLSALLNDFRLQPMKEEPYPHLVTSAEMTEKVERIEREVDRIEQLLRVLIGEVKGLRTDIVPKPAYPTMTDPWGTGPRYDVNGAPGTHYIGDDPKFRAGFTIGGCTWPQKHYRDAEYEDEEPSHDDVGKEVKE